MKNFTVYSKKDIKKPLNISEILDLRYVKNGISLAFIFDITGIFYAFSKKLYKLGFSLIFLMILFLILDFNFPEYENIIFIIKTSINIFLVIFASDLEEFFLSRKGYKMKGFVFAKNIKKATFKVEENLLLSK